MHSRSQAWLYVVYYLQRIKLLFSQRKKCTILFRVHSYFADSMLLFSQQKTETSMKSCMSHVLLHSYHNDDHHYHLCYYSAAFVASCKKKNFLRIITILLMLPHFNIILTKNIFSKKKFAVQENKDLFSLMIHKYLKFTTVHQPPWQKDIIFILFSSVLLFFCSWQTTCVVSDENGKNITMLLCGPLTILFIIFSHTVFSFKVEQKNLLRNTCVPFLASS